MPRIKPPQINPTFSREALEQAYKDIKRINKPTPILNKTNNIFQTLAGIIAYTFMIGLIILSILALIPTQVQ